jgi:AcrR family transcriptional regulator
MRRSQKQEKAVPTALIGPELGSETQNLGRRERKAKETRIRLFGTALQLFAERGFQNVTVEDITEAADVGKGTFFNYFESKEHVLGVMAELQLGHVAEAVGAAARSKNRSVRSILHHLFLQLAGEVGRSSDFARTVMASFLASDVVRGVVQQRMSEGRKALAGVFAEGQVRGEIDAALDRASAALQMQQILLGTVLLWSLYGEPDLKECIENSFRLFWRSIAAQIRDRKP